MLKIFKTFTPQTVIILLLLAIGVKLHYFIDPPSIEVSASNWGIEGIGALFTKLLGDSPRLFVFFGIINIVFQSLIINRIAIAYKLFPTEGFIPSVLFILLTSFVPAWNTLSLPMISLWFIIIPLNALLRLPITSMPRKLLFNAGLSVSIAGLIYFPSIIYIIFIWWAMSIVHPFHWKNLAIVLLGILAPVYITASIYFLLDIPYSNFTIPPFTLNLPTVPISTTTIITLSIFAFTAVCSLYALNIYIEKINEVSKKLWWVIIALTATSAAVALYKMPAQEAGAYFILAPLSLLASNIWMSEKGKWLKIILFWLLLLSILTIQWYL